MKRNDHHDSFLQEPVKKVMAMIETNSPTPLMAPHLPPPPSGKGTISKREKDRMYAKKRHEKTQTFKYQKMKVELQSTKKLLNKALIQIDDLKQEIHVADTVPTMINSRYYPTITHGDETLVEVNILHINNAVETMNDTLFPSSQNKHTPPLPTYKLSKINQDRAFMFHLGSAADLVMTEMKKVITYQKEEKKKKFSSMDSSQWMHTNDTFPATFDSTVIDPFLKMVHQTIKSKVSVDDFRKGLNGGFLKTKKTHEQYLHIDQKSQPRVGCSFSLSMPLTSDGCYLEIFPDISNFSQCDIEDYQVRSSMVFVPPGYVLIWESDVLHAGCYNFTPMTDPTTNITPADTKGDYRCLRLHLTLPPNLFWKNYLQTTTTNSTIKVPDALKNYLVRYDGQPYILDKKKFKTIDMFTDTVRRINNERERLAEKKTNHFCPALKNKKSSKDSTTVPTPLNWNI